MNRRNKTTVATGVAGFTGGGTSAECLQGELHVHSKPFKNGSIGLWAAQGLLDLGPLLPFEAGIFSAGGYFRDFLRIPA